MGKLILIFEMSSEGKNCVCKCVGCLDECESEGDWVVCGECSYVDCVCVYACNVCKYFDCVCGKSDSESEVCVVCKCDDCVCAVEGCVCGVCA